jgi:hypothetical protein
VTTDLKHIIICAMLCGTVLGIAAMAMFGDIVKAWKRLKKGDDE